MIKNSNYNWIIMNKLWQYYDGYINTHTLSIHTHNIICLGIKLFKISVLIYYESKILITALS